MTIRHTARLKLTALLGLLLDGRPGGNRGPDGSRGPAGLGRRVAGDPG